MNLLLKRQLKKYGIALTEDNSEFNEFIETVGRSYNNYQEQFDMLQRSMMISSEELYEANQRLINDTKQQQEIINQLKDIVGVLKGDQDIGLVSKDAKTEKGQKLTDLMELQANEILEINKEREQLLRELAHQNKELSEYAHVVSHDLKSPLRSIDALSSWLETDYKHVLDKNGKETLALIRSSVEKMDSLITGILEYSTVDKNNTSYNVDLNLVVQQVSEFIEKPKPVEVNVVHKLPVMEGDSHRLQQLFQNLIVNAIKYNDKDVVQIDVGFVDVGNYYEFYVRDNGKGMETKYLNKIFEAFFKLQTNTDNSIGLGLSIVKKIVELYKGRIWVNSEVGIGTTFYFTLKK